MNTAQRMEAASKAGCIHVSKSTKELLPKEQWEHTGGIEVSKQPKYTECAFVRVMFFWRHVYYYSFACAQSDHFHACRFSTLVSGCNESNCTVFLLDMHALPCLNEFLSSSRAWACATPTSGRQPNQPATVGGLVPPLRGRRRGGRHGGHLLAARTCTAIR